MVSRNGHSADSHQYANPLPSHTDHYTYSSTSSHPNAHCHACSHFYDRVYWHTYTHTSPNANCHAYA